MSIALLPQVSIIGLLCMLVGIAAKAFYLTLTPPPVSSGPVTDLTSFGPVFLVLGAYITFLYILLFNQSATAFTEHARLIAKAKAQDTKPPTLAEVKYGRQGAVLAADRAVANYLEQSPPFLLSLLLHAVLVSGNGAAKCGWLWLAARALYPFVFSRRFPAVFLSTLPAYGVIGFMLATALHAI